MVNSTTRQINPTLQDWSKNYCKEYEPQIEYFLKFGSPLEKALFSAVIELAGVKK